MVVETNVDCFTSKINTVVVENGISEVSLNDEVFLFSWISVVASM